MLILKNRLIMAALAFVHLVSMTVSFIRYGLVRYAFLHIPVRRNNRM
ncbi:MAG TPA: hypothetical protein VJ821_00385 [Anaerolineales bacterium]|nr:hypothetical protein [Anaerolineales bacterium]